MAATVVASAPGKVLMTGGYLILERPNAGLVLSTSSRFYAIVKPIYDDAKPESWAWAWTDVKLTSPQLSRETSYKLSLKNSTIQCNPLHIPESANPFVEQAVQYAVAAAQAVLADKVDVLHKLLLQGKNQIEARGLPLIPESLASLPPFSSITFNAESSNEENCKPEVAKTGLGSSAAMTTAVVAALLHYLGVVTLPSIDGFRQQEKYAADLEMVHVVSQSAHCIAQGKVGSGFDVSAGVYGSQRYVRFSPVVLSSAQAAVNGPFLKEAIIDVLKEKWDHERAKFSLPPLMTLMLGEPGTGGSSTPSMVGAVKKWQVLEPQKSQETWRMLSDANSALESHLKVLSKFAEEQWETYKSVINSCSILTSEKWTAQATDPTREAVVKALLGARDSFLNIRYHMRLMGNAAGVPDRLLLPNIRGRSMKTMFLHPNAKTSEFLWSFLNIDFHTSCSGAAASSINANVNSCYVGIPNVHAISFSIEPESQSKLLDCTMNVEGVLLAGVPGAGGFDAVFSVTLGDSCSNVSKLWSSLGVLPMLVKEDPRGVTLESGDPRTNEITSGFSSINVV
ncbi:hypothetical protein Syun_018107 [Stephania yunnanensis]|uniref:phosphomevalonate kinase n=1 Tax=Stephania yunnanensis TaxID=152371 RepID=A0AAP0NWQ4_9MAGN